MYADTGLTYPYLQAFHQEIQLCDEFCCSQDPNASMGVACSSIHTRKMSDYNLGGEGDLFKAPEPIVEEPSMGLDPITAVVSMISCEEDAIFPQSLNVSDIELSIESGQLLSDFFYECRKDLLAKDGNETPLSEVLNINISTVKTDRNWTTNEELLAEAQFQKGASSSCLWSTEGMQEAPLRPNHLDFPVLDFGTVYKMRRAFSEGDIKTLGNGNISIIQSNQLPVSTSSCTTLESRSDKLSRYRSKKSKRNFGRKIKYACRKASADSQPRIRGRFAKT